MTQSSSHIDESDGTVQRAGPFTADLERKGRVIDEPFEQPERVMSAREVADRLKADPGSIVRAFLAGLAGPVTSNGKAYFVREDQGRALAEQWPELTSWPEPLTVIRLGPATYVEEPDREWAGWHEGLARKDPGAQMAAIDRWWQIANPEVGHLFLFTVGGFVVFAGRPTRVTSRHGQRWLHLQEEPDPRYHHVRRPTGRGGNVMPLDPCPKPGPE